ncbi:MAG: VCBS repeat-containing protein [Verrucomicrobiota bacterium]
MKRFLGWKWLLFITSAGFSGLFHSSLTAGTVFSRIEVDLPPLVYGSIAWGDLNNDSRQDLLITGADGSFAPISRVVRNLGNGVFTNLNLALPGVSSGSVAWGDLHNDGNLDFLLTGFSGTGSNGFPVYVSEIWRNGTDGNFQKVAVNLPGINSGAVAWADFDNDGNLDFLLTGYNGSGGISQVWRNNGSGGFSNLNAGLTGVFYSSVARADFDNDGYLDIFLTGTTNGFLNGVVCELWRNSRDGKFTNMASSLPAVSQGSVAAGDFDNDGKIDIFITGYSASGPISQIWRNQGNGAFTNWNAGLTGVYQSSVALGDFDNDGLLDILLSGMDAASNAVSQVWRNMGAGTFTNLNETLPGVRSGSSTWGDYDGDGKLDILLTGLDATNNPVLHLFRNNTALRNSTRPLLSNPNQFPSGERLVSFSGKTAFGYTVLGSTNLNSLTWTTLGPAQEANPGTFKFTDKTNFPTRFYRISTP